MRLIHTTFLVLVLAGPGSFGETQAAPQTLFVSPGIQYVTKRWIVEPIVQLPLSQDLNGSAVEDDFIVRAGSRLNF